MRRSVCPFVCLRMIRSVRFQVCVFFCARAVFWTAYVIPCCHGEGPSADSTPPCLFNQKFHACIWAARWQRVSISSSEQKLLTSLQIGKLELSLQLSRMTILCFMKAFWKLSFLYFVIVKCRRAASRCKNFWNTTFEILLFYLLPASISFGESEHLTYEVWGRPCLVPYGLLITEGRIEVRGCVQGVVSREEEG